MARVAFLPLASIYLASCRPELHTVSASDRWPATTLDALVESPTLHVADPATGDDWTLWGLAGHLVAALRTRYPTVPLLEERLASQPA